MSDQHYSLALITAPAAEPFTTAQAKSHLRVTESADDTLIDTLILAARKRAESDLGRALITQTWEMYLDEFPFNYSPGIVPPRAPLQSVTSIKYIDNDGVEQTWSSADYRVDVKSEPGRITPEWSESWPTPRVITNAVTVKYVAGYGDASTDIPQDIRQAMLMLIGHWYENRESIVVGTITAPVPQSYEWLIAPHKVFDF
jgi:uncharacterized phiE125 gp8 family phage protein